VQQETVQRLEALGLFAALLRLGSLLVDGGYRGRQRSDRLVKTTAAADREERPSPEMLEAVQGYTLLRTDRNGGIELSTDEEQLWVEVERR
jgi:hypothetical protein